MRQSSKGYVVVADWGVDKLIKYSASGSEARNIGRDLERQGASVFVARVLSESEDHQVPEINTDEADNCKEAS